MTFSVVMASVELLQDMFEILRDRTMMSSVRMVFHPEHGMTVKEINTVKSVVVDFQLQKAAFSEYTVDAQTAVVLSTTSVLSMLQNASRDKWPVRIVPGQDHCTFVTGNERHSTMYRFPTLQAADDGDDGAGSIDTCALLSGARDTGITVELPILELQSRLRDMAIIDPNLFVSLNVPKRQLCLMVSNTYTGSCASYISVDDDACLKAGAQSAPICGMTCLLRYVQLVSRLSSVGTTVALTINNGGPLFARVEFTRSPGSVLFIVAPLVITDGPDD